MICLEGSSFEGKSQDCPKRRWK